MMLGEFLAQVESIYGPYNKVQREILAAKLGVYEEHLGTLLNRLVDTVPTKWGRPPWITEMYPILDELDAVSLRKEARELAEKQLKQRGWCDLKLFYFLEGSAQAPQRSEIEEGMNELSQIEERTEEQ